MKRCLIIFAKEPESGKVKTRLRKYLSQSRCLDLYKAFLRDTVALAGKLDCSLKILAYASGAKEPGYLKKIAGHFKFYAQKGNNLGRRMYNACKFARDKGASKIIIIGSDSPILPARIIKKGFSLLNNVDLVLGPSSDGGYYLIGLKSPVFGLFKGVQWSSRTVLKATLKNARMLKKSIALLDEFYDVDDRAALIRLKKDLKRSKNENLARWTRKYLGKK